jgi:hypothetical protein
MFPSACSFFVCWFPLSFTACFVLHGYLQVCRILHMFIFIYLRIKTEKQNPGLCLRLRSALLYVGFHCLSLHVSAYMAIFRCVGFFIYLRILLRCFISLPFCTWSHSSCFPFVFCSCAVFLRVFWCFLVYAFVYLLFICEIVGWLGRWWIWKNLEGILFKATSWNVLKGTRKIKNNLCKYSSFADRDWNTTLPGYKSRVLQLDQNMVS